METQSIEAPADDSFVGLFVASEFGFLFVS